MSESLVYNEARFACRCGRFLAESAIRHTDHRDDSRYYGVRTEVEWDCTRCGTVRGEEWEPQIVVVGTRAIPPAPNCEVCGDPMTEPACKHDGHLRCAACLTDCADCGQQIRDDYAAELWRDGSDR